MLLVQALKIANAELRQKIMQTVGDREAMVILHAIRTTPMNAQTISRETGVPLSSVCRKLAAPKAAGLAMLSSFVLTHEGKRQDLVVSAVTDVRISVIGGQVEVELVPTPQNSNRIWFELFRA